MAPYVKIGEQSEGAENSAGHEYAREVEGFASVLLYLVPVSIKIK